MALKGLAKESNIACKKVVRWSAVPVAPKVMYVTCGGERGSGPEGADDLTCFEV